MNDIAFPSLFGLIHDSMAKIAHVFQFHYLTKRETHPELFLNLGEQYHIGQRIPSLHLVGRGVFGQCDVVSFQYFLNIPFRISNNSFVSIYLIVLSYCVMNFNSWFRSVLLLLFCGKQGMK